MAVPEQTEIEALNTELRRTLTREQWRQHDQRVALERVVVDTEWEAVLQRIGRELVATGYGDAWRSVYRRFAAITPTPAAGPFHSTALREARLCHEAGDELRWLEAA